MKLVETLTDDLEAQSFRNMVEFYQDELRQIMGGQNARHLLSITVRANLMRNRILKKGGVKGNSFTITTEAQALLSYRKKIEKG